MAAFLNRRNVARTMPTAARHLLALLLLAAIPMPRGAAIAQAADRPFNLLLITADDLSMNSSGWLGSKVGATPNLDKFAATAHRFVNHHVSCAICQPSRSALFTGRVPHRNGALGFNPIRTDVPTLVELLAARGYYTAAINKTAHMKPDAKFPWHQTFEGSGKNPSAVGRDMATALNAAGERSFFINANITDPHRPFPGSQQEQARGTKTKARKAKPNSEGIDAFSPSEVTVPTFLEDIPPVRAEVAEYFTGVRRFDRSFGEVIAALEASGKADNTVIIVLSDHGMSFPFSKATVYRNGTWSPLLLRWPGMGKPAVNESLVSSVDVLPTTLEILGDDIPTGLDGRSWLPLLQGETQPDRDHVITHINTVSSGKSVPQRCIRTKTRSYQFHPWSDGQTHFRVEAMNGITFDALVEAAQADERIRARVAQFQVGTPQAFYDLEKDPDERVNLIDDPKYRTEIEALRRKLLAHMERTDDPQLTALRKLLNNGPQASGD